MILRHSRVPQSNDHYCGPATARMIIEARIGARTPGQAELGTVMAHDEDGTDRHAMRAALAAHLPHGYRVHALNEGAPLTPTQRDSLFAGLRQCLDLRFGAALAVLVVHDGPRPAWFPNPRPDHPIDHWLAVFGYDAPGGRILVTDPAHWGISGLPPGTDSHWIAVADVARYAKTYVC